VMSTGGKSSIAIRCDFLACKAKTYQPRASPWGFYIVILSAIVLILLLKSLGGRSAAADC
jgi:hypothetical protein